MVRLLGVALMLLLAGCDLAAGMKLEGAVTDALKKDPRTSSSSFEVAAEEGGVVTITGEVANAEEQMAVAEIAKAVPGVTSVNNRTAVPEEGSGMMQDTVVPSVVGGF